MPLQRRALLSCVPGLLLGGRAEAQESDEVVYPRHLAAQDGQVRYFVELMRLALARSGRRYRLRQTRLDMVQSRALIELAGEQPSIDVFWTMSDAQRERSLLPVRVPLERGLIGWRLALVRRDELVRFEAVRSLAELARFTAGQMHDWPDTEILRSNGLPVYTSTHYQGLFEMLGKGRFDYFPRSIMEVDAELQAFPGQDLVIAPRLLLHYPAALYLFVRPGRPRLAEDLRRGMEALVADGTFERLSQRQFGPLLARHRTDQRRVLRLHNPLLSGDTPLARNALWLQPPR
jgi:hypothetical protein